jgi:hypothetical protein
MQGNHAYASLRRAGPALTSAAAVRPDDVPTIAYGRHLLDLAQAHLDSRHLDAAQGSLLEARSLSAEWFRHQGPARSLVAELVGRRTRLSPTLRDLAGSVGVA